MINKKQNSLFFLGLATLVISLPLSVLFWPWPFVGIIIGLVFIVFAYESYTRKENGDLYV